MLMIPKNDPIWNVSNPKIVQQKAYEIYGKNAQILRSKSKPKNMLFMIQIVNQLISDLQEWKITRNTEMMKEEIHI